MGANFTPLEGSVLYRLLAETTTDIILKSDRDGYIQHASPAIERLGFLLPTMLIGPHILDLVHPSRADAVRAEHDAAVNGQQSGKWIEFPAMTAKGPERWFEIKMRCLADSHDRIYGVLSIMRSIEEKRNLEEKLFTAEMTDPLTGLTNRVAFMGMLRHLVEERIDGCLALFDIDHFTAINMQYGQSVGDEVLVVFSDFLRTLMRSDDIISRIGGESLAVLLPGAAPGQAEALCQRIIGTLAEIRRSVPPEGLHVTASAGVARFGNSLDNTIRRAETALFLAKAKGRNRLEMDSWPRLPEAKLPKPG